MSALKEIKKRINSIKSTRKTTSAMKMVSSSKLRKAENSLSNIHQYAAAIRHIMESLMTGAYSCPYSVERPLKNVALIAFSSDSSLCGAFNSNISRELQKTYKKLGKSSGIETVFVYTIGKKVYDSIRKTGMPVTKHFENLAGKPDYKTISDFAAILMKQFENKQIDRINLIYHRFKSAGTQELVNAPLLPLTLPVQQNYIDYIVEPSREAALNALLPNMINTVIYTALLDSNTSEHAARMIAMQTATDNADDLISELTIEYNKSRQQAITSELLDLIGGNAK